MTSPAAQRRPRSLPGLLSVLVALVALCAGGAALVRSNGASRLGLDEAGGLVVQRSYYDTFKEKVDAVLREVDPAFDQAGASMDEAIRWRVDAAFAPVYAAIPAYVEFHYSIPGQYSELGSAVLADQLTSQFQRILIDDTRLEQGLADAQSALSDDYAAILSEPLGRLRGALRTELDLGAAEMGVVSQVASLSAEDARARLAVASGVTGAVTVGLAARAVGQALAKRVAARGAVSLAARGESSAAGGGAGLAICPPHPLIKAACGAVGAIVGFFVVDAALIEADQALFSEQFTAEVTRLVDEEKQRIVSELQSAYAAQTEAIRSRNAEKLRGARVIDLID